MRKKNLNTSIVLYMLLVKHPQGLSMGEIKRILSNKEGRLVINTVRRHAPVLPQDAEDVAVEYHDPEELLCSWKSLGLVLFSGEGEETKVVLTQGGIIVLASDFAMVNDKNLDDFFQVAVAVGFGHRQYVAVIQSLSAK